MKRSTYAIITICLLSLLAFTFLLYQRYSLETGAAGPSTLLEQASVQKLTADEHLVKSIWLVIKQFVAAI